MRWAHRNREWIGLRAFKQGLSPIVIALQLSSVWLLSAVHNDPARDWKLWLLTVVVTGGPLPHQHQPAVDARRGGAGGGDGLGLIQPGDCSGRRRTALSSQRMTLRRLNSK